MPHRAEAKPASCFRIATLWGVGLLLAAWGALQPAQAEALPPAVQQALRQARLPASALSVAVVPVQGRGQPLWVHAEQAVNPASLMKLVTSYAALELLGPAHRWTTELRAERLPQQGVLHGDLYLQGVGDPKLSQERLWLLLRALRARGVEEIRGDLVLDRSQFRLAPQAGYDDRGGQAERPFLVTPDALLLNFKAVRLSVREAQGRVQAVLDPALPEVTLDNQLQSGPAADCAAWREQMELKVEDSGERAVVRLTGRLPAGCSGERYLALLDHPTYAASLVKTLWRELGGRWRGGVRQGATPAASVVLASSQSPELALLLRDINKYSNNSMARQVYLSLGAQLGREPDGEETSQRAQAVLQRWLATRGWRWPELVLENGSGLSRSERISPRHLSELLSHAWRGPWAAEFVASLPIVAVDGTMKRRLLNEPLAGEAHIKTGSLRDVRSIAGYVRGQQGSVWAVVAVLNHPQASDPRALAVLDEVLRQVARRRASH